MNSHDVYATLKSITAGKRAGVEGLKDFALNYEKLPSGRDCTDSKDIKYFDCWCQLNITKFYEQKNRLGYFYVAY